LFFTDLKNPPLLLAPFMAVFGLAVGLFDKPFAFLIVHYRNGIRYLFGFVPFVLSLVVMFAF
jgi:hypothetical protein